MASTSSGDETFLHFEQMTFIIFCTVLRIWIRIVWLSWIRIQINIYENVILFPFQ